MEGARLARNSDLAALVGLGAEAADELRELRGGPALLEAVELAGRTESCWSEWLASPTRAIWVGSIGGSVLGYSVVEENLLRRTAVLEEIYVSVPARGVGIGTAMMDAVRAWGVSRGCLAVEAVVLPGSREAKNFFEQSGLKARLLVMQAGLGPLEGGQSR